MNAAVNGAVAGRLREMADLLEQQHANPFRVNAYRRAARTVDQLDEPLAELFEAQGLDGLEQLPGIGHSIGLAISEMLTCGRWLQLERLRGALDPEQVFQSIPGLGPELARRIHDELEIESLEALEQAAHDGRLESVDGIGPRRSRMIAARSAFSCRVRRRPIIDSFRR